jgi:glycosyltransferase involved in cell wall biosynthesis
MHVLLIHNEYGKVSGEEIAVRSLQKLLEERGQQVSTYYRSSAEIIGNKLKMAGAFWTGIYSRSAQLHVRRILVERRPDVVHVHNLFPLISPSVLGECRRAGVPLVMTVHNYRLMCPNGLHLVDGQVCERCVGGEHHCVLKRCEGTLVKSAGYALRNAVARKLRFFHDNVTLYAALTQFQRQRLIAGGFAADRIRVIPNMLSGPSAAPAEELGQWIGYAGRVSREKGIETLMQAAAMLPDIPFRIAGDADRMSHLQRSAPSNVRFVGHLSGDALHQFYAGCRMVTLCSTWFEGFPMMLIEAMLHGKPIVCSNIGGLPEIVDDGKTGTLFQPGDPLQLRDHLRRLWSEPDLCRRMGMAGWSKAHSEYSSERYYERLMELYHHALKVQPARAGRDSEVMAVH